MLKIAYSASELDFDQLCQVYEQSCTETGALEYPDLSANERLLSAFQDLYGQVRCFYRIKNAFYAVWIEGGRYVSALRIEPYKDGFLLTGLETAPEVRGKGYATSLTGAVLSELAKKGSVSVYSHVGKRNTSSVAVHKACGFQKHLDHAVYLDGSVSTDAYTLKITV